MSRSRKKVGVIKSNGSKYPRRLGHKRFRRANKVNLKKGIEDIVPLKVLICDWDICDWKWTEYWLKDWNKSNPDRYTEEEYIKELRKMKMK